MTEVGTEKRTAQGGHVKPVLGVIVATFLAGWGFVQLDGCAVTSCRPESSAAPLGPIAAVPNDSYLGEMDGKLGWITLPHESVPNAGVMAALTGDIADPLTFTPSPKWGEGPPMGW